VKYIARDQIKNLFIDPQQTLIMDGLWLSGYEGEGENRSYYFNGQLKETSFYKNNEINGETRGWYPNGQLKELKYYKNNYPDGEFKRWDETGQIYEHGFVKNARLYGEYKTWSRKGKLTMHRLYATDGSVSYTDYLK